MVYYGRLSKGCERCRQRKVKCDQGRPGCSRCLKSSLQCPGYRDIEDLLFRDESERILRKARKPLVRSQDHGSQPFTPITCKSFVASFCARDEIMALKPPNVDNPGAHFFFSMFIADDGPTAAVFRNWLMQSYFDDRACGGLRSIIEAVGLSAIANIYTAPSVEIRAKQRCSRATDSLRCLLSDPYSASLDCTLMTVILFGMYETINFQGWARREPWLAHVKAIIALLELRGEKQFETELGAQIYIHARTSIISACAQQQVVVPLPLVRLTHVFQESEVRRLWRRHHIATPGSICELSFRLTNLLAACNNQTINADTICERALDIDNDLELWQQGLPPHLKGNAAAPNADSDTKDRQTSRSEYRNAHIVEAWNHWRTQRIMTNKIIIHSNDLPDEKTAQAQSVLQQMGNDLCVSTLNMGTGPRIMWLIEPLFLVAVEDSVSLPTKVLALEQLRGIGRTMGVRQAVLLADAGFRYLAGESMPVKLPCLQFESERSISPMRHDYLGESRATNHGEFL